MSELPKMPTPSVRDPTWDATDLLFYRLEWHIKARGAYLAYLKRAMEYAGHKCGQDMCAIRTSDAPFLGCTCGLDAFRAFLREQGVSDE